MPTSFPVPGTFRAAMRTACLGIVLGASAAPAQPTSPSAVMVAQGLAPGQRMRVLLRTPSDTARAAAHERVEGGLVTLDSASVAVRLRNGDVRTFERADVAELRAYTGRSRWGGVLAGWLVSLPIALGVCLDAKYECMGGSLIGMLGMTGGAIVGWPRWKRVDFP